MKHLFRLLLLLCVFIFCSLNASWRIVVKGGLPVILSVCEGDLTKEKAVIKASFTAAYQGTEIARIVQEKHGNLARFLDVAFEAEEIDFFSKKSDTFFVSAKKDDGEVIGFVAFDKNSDIEGESFYVYVRQLAVHSKYQHNNLGLFLIFSFLNIWPDCRFVKLLTRRLNSIAVGFYKRLGFRECEYVREGYDPGVYVGLEYAFDSTVAGTIYECYYSTC
jgi:ribosomal protein S18 acetylase RimI-like enzyme